MSFAPIPLMTPELPDRGRQEEEGAALLLTALAHELRNPLAPITTGLHVLQLELDPPKRAWVLAVMDRQLRLLARLIEGLLAGEPTLLALGTRSAAAGSSSALRSFRSRAGPTSRSGNASWDGRDGYNRVGRHAMLAMQWPLPGCPEP
jgi:hypothetical protein